MMSEDEVFELSLRIAQILSPYVNLKTVQTGSPDARLARHLMDEDGRVVVKFAARAAAWYASLQSHYEWNSRYWEQSALNAMRRGERKRAREYANTAVGKEPNHWQAQTTAARVLMDSAENDLTGSLSERQRQFQDAVELLDGAIRRALANGRNDVHPFHLLLDVSCRISQKIFGSTPLWLREVLRAHVEEAGRLLSSRAEIRAALSALKRAGVA